MDFKRVSPKDAKQLLGEGYTYVDVRSEPEFEEAHPVGALNVPLLQMGPAGLVPNSSFVADMQKLFAPDAKIVVGCKAGGRSMKAAQALVSAGFTNIVDQRAGFDGSRDAFGKLSEPGWGPSGLPVEKGNTPGATYADLKKRG